MGGHLVEPKPVTVGEVQLSVHEAGEGPAVVLLHGFPEIARSWRHQLPAIAAAGWRAIAYDQRGYGGSSKPAGVEPYRLVHLVDDLAALLDALEIDEAVVVGHDWGSIVTWSAAVMIPDRVRAVVSLNVPYRGWCCGFPDTATIRDRLADRFGYVLAFQEPGWAERAFAADPGAWLRRTLDALAGRPGAIPEDEMALLRDALVAGGLDGPLGWYRNIDRNVADVAHLADAVVTQPTMLIVPDGDPVLPASLAEGMGRWVPQLRTEHVADCGHWTQQERPERVNELLVDFLTHLDDG